MKLLFICFLLYSNFSFCQNTPKSFWENRCNFKTDGSGKSIGLKIQISIPCEWKTEEGERPHVVKKFSFKTGEGLASASVTINQLETKLSKDEIDLMFSNEGLKEIAEEFGTFISGRKLKIDGEDCGEVTFKLNRETPVSSVYMYGIYYYFIYNNKMIVIGFSAGSITEEKAKHMFNNYQKLFHALASKTIILSKWE